MVEALEVQLRRLALKLSCFNLLLAKKEAVRKGRPLFFVLSEYILRLFILKYFCKRLLREKLQRCSSYPPVGSQRSVDGIL